MKRLVSCCPLSDPEPQKILVAVAWPYASGPRHIGHVAGFGVPSDIFARYHRLKGNDVLMVSGTDEHGTPVMVAADREGVSPRELADRYNELIREDLRDLGISYDLFTRTTTRNHHRVTRDVFRALYDNGFIFEQTTMGAFSASTGRTLPDRYIEGTCPICGFSDARGDQCDNCGNQLDPVDLIDPRSKIDGTPPVFKETKHLFLDLPAFREQLATWIEANTHWRPNVRNFSLQLVKEIKPRAVTRDLDWGVRVPVPGYEEREDKRIYVWIDAVVGYLSASVEWAKNSGEPDAWREWWQNPESRHVYFMGKDNIVFHAIIWPAELLGYREGGELGAGHGPLQLPENVVASEYLTMESKQFSVSRGVGIYVHDFLARYDPDPLRYFLTAAGPETQDTDFTWAEFVRRNNDELLANWGNLVNRALTSAYRNFGEVPEPGELAAPDRALLEAVEAGFEAVGTQIDQARFKAALAEAMRLASLVNAYINDQAPWKTLGTDRSRAATVLYVALRAIDNLKTLFTPFLPFSSQRVHEFLGYEGFIAGPLEFRDVREEDGSEHTILTGDYASWVGRWEASNLLAGQRLQEPRPLFKKLDPGIVEEELRRMDPDASPPESAAA
jgi:methionyl-tRNA synthetase